jgi:hypothetical protein
VMDKLDKLSAVAITVLVLWMLVLVVQEKNRPVPDQDAEIARKEAAARRYFDPAYDKKITLAKKLLIANNIDSVTKIVDEMILAYPFEGMPFMLKGDIALRRQEPIAAAIEYRKAVDLNPDYLDKKAEDFQGKKIKKTVEESLSLIELALKNGDLSSEMKENKQVMYYMLRKIAGSCS